WPGRIIAVFQPHLYSRTAKLADSFGRSFYNADLVVVTDVYGDREEPMRGVSGRLISDACTASGHKAVNYVEDMAFVARWLLDIVRPGDMVLTMGAGDVYKVGEELLRLLKARSENSKARATS
ncbi:UDP-N-acetylmuramate--L-alanine ligase, partial [candidate division TA06 bacterium]